MTLEQCFIKDSEAAYQAAQSKDSPVLTGITERQYDNIEINTTVFDRKIIEHAVRELQTIKSIDNAPQITEDYTPSRGTYITMKLGYWTIQSDKNGIRIEEYLDHTISIPDISYDRIRMISFDTYIDKSHLVGIWIALNDYTMYRVLTTRKNTRRP